MCANTEVLNDYNFKKENIFNDFKKLFNLENHGANDVIDDVYFSFKNELKFTGNRYETNFLLQNIRIYCQIIII